MKRLVINILLLGAIAALGYFVLYPLILCFAVGGSWQLSTRVCHMGTVSLGDTPARESTKELPPPSFSPVDLKTIRTLTISIPDRDSALPPVVLSREEGTERLTATFAMDPTEEFPHGSAIVDLRVATTSSDGKYFVAPLAINTGGTGWFVHAALFVKETHGIQHADSLLLGDRIVVESTKFVDAKTVSIKTLQRKPTEPMAAQPSVSVTQTISFGANNLFASGTAVLEYNDRIRVRIAPLLNALSSPIVLSGHAQGQRFFEGSFPVVIKDGQGKNLGTGIATAQDEWMTSDYVPFTASVVFSVPISPEEKYGRVVFEKDNSSGLAENADSLEIPVQFK